MDASFAVMSLAIGAGSALGGMLRYWCLFLIACTLGETFLLGTLFVNVVGSFLIVLIAEVTGQRSSMLRSSLLLCLVSAWFGHIAGATVNR